MHTNSRLPDGKDAELPEHTVSKDGSVAWKGEPLKFSHLQEIIFAIRLGIGSGWNESLESAKGRWNRIADFIKAVLIRIPTSEILDSALERMPDYPRVPAKPRKSKFLKIFADPNSVDEAAYSGAMKKWVAAMATYRTAAASYETQIPVMQHRVGIWKRYGGAEGIDKL